MDHVPDQLPSSDPNKPRTPSKGASEVALWARDYAEDLQRFLAKRRVIQSDIKDICQEVYLRLLRFDRGEAIRNPAAYLFRVAANVAHDFNLRKPKWAPLDTEDLDAIPADSGAEDLAETVARRRTLFRALDTLPPIPRAALALQAREDLSHEEIAQRLGISRRAVRKAVTRGHELLRAVLNKGI
jgi:RNA polymerase sigma factor (sigma-70 family)